MPIRPENRGRYPADWPDIAVRIKVERAEGRCECRGECGRPLQHLDEDGRCRNRHGEPIWEGLDSVPATLFADHEGAQVKLVVLTTAHRNHVPEDCRDTNLFAACQGCHLHHDIEHHRRTRESTRVAALLEAMEPLFTIGGAE